MAQPQQEDEYPEHPLQHLPLKEMTTIVTLYDIRVSALINTEVEFSSISGILATHCTRYGAPLYCGPATLYIPLKYGASKIKLRSPYTLALSFRIKGRALIYPMIQIPTQLKHMIIGRDLLRMAGGRIRFDKPERRENRKKTRIINQRRRQWRGNDEALGESDIETV